MSREPLATVSLPPHLMAAYVRNAKAVGVLWAIFTVCYAVVAVLIFFQPYWLGSTDRSDQTGVFGLYQYCTYVRSADVSVESCQGEIADYNRILNPFFRASTLFVGLSALAILLCIVCMLLFFCVQSKVVFFICAGLQFVSFLCLFVGCTVYPAGWDHSTVKNVCGPSATKYNKGVCELRWTYILAIVGIFDSLFLAILGFVLASKQVKPLGTNGHLRFANVTSPTLRGPSSASTVIVQQQLTPNKVNGASQISNGTKPSNRTRAEYAASVQHFQL